jgi:hypothetical protein
LNLAKDNGMAPALGAKSRCARTTRADPINVARCPIEYREARRRRFERAFPAPGTVPCAANGIMSHREKLTN